MQFLLSIQDPAQIAPLLWSLSWLFNYLDGLPFLFWRKLIHTSNRSIITLCYDYLCSPWLAIPFGNGVIGYLLIEKDVNSFLGLVFSGLPALCQTVLMFRDSVVSCIFLVLVNGSSQVSPDGCHHFFCDSVLFGHLHLLRYPFSDNAWNYFPSDASALLGWVSWEADNEIELGV